MKTEEEQDAVQDEEPREVLCVGVGKPPRIPTIINLGDVTLGLRANEIHLVTASLASMQLRSLHLYDTAVTSGEGGGGGGEMCFVDVADFLALVRALLLPQEQSGGLAKLSLVGFPLGHRCVSALCRAIITSEQQQLTELTLSRAFMGTIGARAVARVLAHPRCQLRKLHLPRNYMGEHGIALIARALGVRSALLLHPLKSLDLSCNLVTRKAAAALECHVLRCARVCLEELIVKEEAEEEVDEFGQGVAALSRAVGNMRVGQACLALSCARQRTGGASTLARIPVELLRLLAEYLIV